MSGIVQDQYKVVAEPTAPKVIIRESVEPQIRVEAPEPRMEAPARAAERPAAVRRVVSGTSLTQLLRG